MRGWGPQTSGALGCAVLLPGFGIVSCRAAPACCPCMQGGVCVLFKRGDTAAGLTCRELVVTALNRALPRVKGSTPGRVLRAKWISQAHSVLEQVLLFCRNRQGSGIAGLGSMRMLLLSGLLLPKACLFRAPAATPRKAAAAMHQTCRHGCAAGSLRGMRQGRRAAPAAACGARCPRCRSRSRCPAR